MFWQPYEYCNSIQRLKTWSIYESVLHFAFSCHWIPFSDGSSECLSIGGSTGSCATLVCCHDSRGHPRARWFMSAGKSGCHRSRLARELCLTFVRISRLQRGLSAPHPPHPPQHYLSPVRHMPDFGQISHIVAQILALFEHEHEPLEHHFAFLIGGWADGKESPPG